MKSLAAMHPCHPRQILSFIAITLCLGASTPVVAQSEISETPSQDRWSVESHNDSLKIVHFGTPIAEYVYRDPTIRRPYFSNIRTVQGLQVTRNHPPVQGTDATDHDTMHPGIWLGFGELNGIDFWRNRGWIEHNRFTKSPNVHSQGVSFATESHLLDEHRERIGKIHQRFDIFSVPLLPNTDDAAPQSATVNPPANATGWMLIWDTTLEATQQPLVFGDQEEMGFGARVATAITEKNGGRLLNARGQKTASQTWGKTAAWCDYSGVLDQQSVGITLMADSKNFRDCWWHTRDYGLMVANPFGRQAMTQGERSEIRVEVGDSLTLRFGAYVHSGVEAPLEDVYRDFLNAQTD